MLHKYISCSFIQVSTPTETNPFPPLASPSLRPLGCLFIVSLLFCWYSSSIVMAATPFATAPVIREAAPAIPPERQTSVWRFFSSHFIFSKHKKKNSTCFICILKNNNTQHENILNTTNNTIIIIIIIILTRSWIHHLYTLKLYVKSNKIVRHVQTAQKYPNFYVAFTCIIFSVYELWHTNSSSHQCFHPKSHSLNKLLRSLDSSLRKQR